MLMALAGAEGAASVLRGRPVAQVPVDDEGTVTDIDTVDALAQALIDYSGTVIFTSHDRHFMHRVATSVIEVRDARVVNYPGDYDSYVYSVNKEIEEGERLTAAKQSPGKPRAAAGPVDAKKRHQEQRDLRKQLQALERNIEKLDTRKREVNAALLQSTDPNEAVRLHNELTAIAAELEPIEERWCELSAQMEDDD